jgi:hypothetical protein
VRKLLDAADVQGSRDMSGFEFDVSDASGTSVGRLTTAADGRTPPIEAEGGTYTIREIARPAWAATLGDDGPVTFFLDPANGVDIREISYTNTVPAATIATSARDGADGDQVIDLHRGDATVIDTVTYAGLVPGTGYVVTGELMVRPDTDDADDADAGTPMIATGVTGSTSFVPTGPGGSVEVEFDVPADSPLLGHTVVVYEQLAIGLSGRVIATHADPEDPAQTIDLTGSMPATTIPGTTIPASTIPASTIPASTIPASTIPASTIPASTIPTGTAPPTTVAVTNEPPASPPTAPATPTTPPVQPSATLPRTGAESSRRLAVAALTLMLLGIALVSTTGVPRPTRADLRHGFARQRSRRRRNRVAGSAPPE